MKDKNETFSNTAPEGEPDLWLLTNPPDKPLVMRDEDAPYTVVSPSLVAMRKIWDEMDDEDKAAVGEELARQLFGQDEEDV